MSENRRVTVADGGLPMPPFNAPLACRRPRSRQLQHVVTARLSHFGSTLPLQKDAGQGGSPCSARAARHEPCGWASGAPPIATNSAGTRPVRRGLRQTGSGRAPHQSVASRPWTVCDRFIHLDETEHAHGVGIVGAIYTPCVPPRGDRPKVRLSAANSPPPEGRSGGPLTLLSRRFASAERSQRQRAPIERVGCLRPASSTRNAY